MKLYQIFFIVVFLISTNVYARLYETQAQIKERYGTPTDDSPGKNNERSEIYCYKHGGLIIIVFFLDGKSQNEGYVKPTTDNVTAADFTSDEIQSLLDANSLGKTWTLNKSGGWTLGSFWKVIANAKIENKYLTIRTVELEEYLRTEAEKPENINKRLQGF
jgi:hypothetical protein